jgi:hypothetical protein
MNREVDEIGTSSLLRRGNVDGQYVAHSFKWIKQHLRIKRFYGTSENAVRTQIWIAISVYVLVAIIKKQLRLDVTLHTLLQILSLTLFEKLPMQQAFGRVDPVENNLISDRQLKLFEF